MAHFDCCGSGRRQSATVSKRFTRLPPASYYAQTPELAESAGWLMAAELLAVGVDFSFAPVLDVDCGVSEIIGNRSFSTDPNWQHTLPVYLEKV